LLGGADAEERVGRIAWEEAQQHEQHNRCDEQRGDKDQRAADGVGENGLSPCAISGATIAGP